ncbi:chalcone isomerase family protein [Xenophilus sp. Marseille-Q4582]|uniref:chalcone isomerase family protein n=1 Tax=Xenophilus sp. Marseille-Q4582 TaxID=2866600 RepID=UPI001CE451D6|nr:chalcone isomerase family protein [Xenophilus sp. Marseille-Q4582]
MLARFGRFNVLGAAIALAALSSALAAAPVDVGGIVYPDPLPLGGETLRLNGAGVRYKAVFKVYAAGLYLPARASSADEALAQPGPKRIAITMLRDIDANELGKLFTRGVEENSTRAEFGQLVPGLLRMGQIFADQKQLKAGDAFHVDWIPGTGAQVVVRGTPQGEPIREPAFFTALLRIWLGPVPADARLKEALLGKAP